MERLRIGFRYRRGEVVGYGRTRSPCTVVWQRYQTRTEGSASPPLVSYHVEDAQGHTCWVSEADLWPAPGIALGTDETSGDDA